MMNFKLIFHENVSIMSGAFVGDLKFATLLIMIYSTSLGSGSNFKYASTGVIRFALSAYILAINVCPIYLSR
mgnify:CR=1 FL=1